MVFVYTFTKIHDRRISSSWAWQIPMAQVTDVNVCVLCVYTTTTYIDHRLIVMLLRSIDDVVCSQHMAETWSNTLSQWRR